MFKKFLSLSGVIFGASANLIMSPVNSVENSPYVWAYVGFAINFCATEYGIFKDADAYTNINSFMKNKFNMEPWQVYNLTQRKGFYKDTAAFIKKKGGCSVIAKDLQNRINAQPRGFSGLNFKKNNNHIYKID
tara:strand:- start:73 stop:471 length:399 start_codon:yes stop_codon:yes gene_type:complete